MSKGPVEWKDDRRQPPSGALCGARRDFQGRLLKARMAQWVGLLLLAAGASSGSLRGADHYVGRQVCAKCHPERARQAAASNFAGSWRPVSTLSPEGFPKETREGKILYRVERRQGRWVYTVQLPGHPPQTFAVHSLIGGNRFGLSFMLRVSQLESLPLARPTLVEARYMLDAKTGRLRLSPGFPPQTPTNYETALGRVLSRDFADKCLDCHGGIADPKLAAQGGPHPLYVDTGVGCEKCHGPGSSHVEAQMSGDLQLDTIVNPAKLPHSQVMRLCGRCHSGFFSVVHPRPQDLLISNQVTALEHSDCYLQSQSGFSCVSCHDPHHNARHDDPIYVKTCLSCHSSQASARPCPVNPHDGCIECHMPRVTSREGFTLVDHWIRRRPQREVSGPLRMQGH